MARSTKKGPYVPLDIQKKLDKLNAENKKGTIKTWHRDATITLDFVGHTFLVHNGRKFIPVYITESMLDHKCGEFSETRKPVVHSSKTKK